MAGSRTPTPGKVDPIILTLRERREGMKLSRKIVGDKTGYDRVSIYHWETGRATPSLTKIKDWAECLGLQLEVRERDGQ